MSEKITIELRRYGLANGTSLGRHMALMDIADDELDRLQSENEQLKELLRLIEEKAHGNCDDCEKTDNCTKRQGSHKYCWKREYFDKPKEVTPC